MCANPARFFTVIVFAWLLVLTSSTGFGATNSPSYRVDQILIKPRGGITQGALEAFHAGQHATLRRAFHTGGMQLIAVPPNETVQDLIVKYQKSGLVEFAEPDYTVYPDATMPNDPAFVNGTLWALYNYGQNGGTAGADIDAPDAWDVLTSASNIVVAVLDSGIRYTHQDLAANMWVNPVDGGHGYNAFDGTNDPTDDNTSHGTMVAGVLGAVGNNGVGVTGVAWRVQMMACKCLNNGTGSDSTVIACIDYALANGAQIINASFGASTGSAALSNAIVAVQSAGVIWVASAGNNSSDDDVTPEYPTCYGLDNIVSVAYTTRTDALGHFSNYGATNVLLGAPGDQIYTTFDASDSYYWPPNGSIDEAGTSFSAAYVSGALALMLAKYPTENYHQIIQRLANATDPIPALQGKCITGGRLNLRKALNPDMWLTANREKGGAMKLQLSTGPGRLCVIQSSTNLVDWTPLYTNTTSTNGIFDFTNPAPSSFQLGWPTPTQKRPWTHPDTTLPSEFFRATTIP